MAEKKEKLLVVKELPLRQYNTVTDAKGEELKLVTLEEATQEILISLRDLLEKMEELLKKL